MIKINELRIGNYLSLCDINYAVSEIQNSLQTVELKRKNTVNPKLNEYEECDLDCEELEPIKLTEELLLKFGFELYYESLFCKRFELLSNTEICYAFSNVEDYKGAVGFSYVGKVIQNINNVHQLQNIYFALVGEELVFSSTEP